MSQVQIPPMEKSDEATEEQLEMAREQGAALGRALHHMTEEEADDGAEKQAGDGEYTLRVRIEAPDFGRHDRKNGRRYAEEVETEFSGVKIKTGQK